MTRRVVFIVLAPIAFGLGCADSPNLASPTTEGRELTIIAIDRSGSTEAIRQQLLAATHELATGLDARQSNLVLFRFGHSVEEIYSGVPDDEDAFALLLAKAAKESDPREGTQYPEMLHQLAICASSAKEHHIRVIVAGDGLNDYVGNKAFDKEYRDAARSLASNSKVELIRFWGAEPGAREELRRIFRGNESKLQVRSLDQNIDD